MVTETFGDMLFCPECECLKEFPTPEDLKYKIIISTKPPKEYLEAEGNKDKMSNSEKEKDSDDDVWGKEPTELTADQEDENVCLQMNLTNVILHLFSTIMRNPLQADLSICTIFLN